MIYLCDVMDTQYLLAHSMLILKAMSHEEQNRRLLQLLFYEQLRQLIRSITTNSVC